MNCKPGDLAMVVRCNKATDNNLGKVITVRSISGVVYDHGPAWKYDPPLFTKRGQLIEAAEDAALIPIRPGDLHETEEDRKEVTA